MSSRRTQRVLETERALAAGDLAAVGRLFAASHASLRDLFEVSSPELDAFVEIAAATDGVVAARMTGAGFGGSTVNLVRRGRVTAFREAVERDYPARTGLRPTVLEVDAVDGAGFLRTDCRLSNSGPGLSSSTQRRSHGIAQRRPGAGRMG